MESYAISAIKELLTNMRNLYGETVHFRASLMWSEARIAIPTEPVISGVVNERRLSDGPSNSIVNGVRYPLTVDGLAPGATAARGTSVME